MAGHLIGTTRKLTLLEVQFILAYVKHFDAVRALIEAGYRDNPTTNMVRALNILRRPAVRDTLREKLEVAAQVKKFDMNKALQLMISAATCDVRGMMDENGNLKPIKELTYEQQFLLEGLEVFEEYQGAGEKREYVGRTKKFKLASRQQALRTMMEHLGAFKQVVDINEKITHTTHTTHRVQVDIGNIPTDLLEQIYGAIRLHAPQGGDGAVPALPAPRVVAAADRH